jgi:monoamine oxidase
MIVGTSPNLLSIVESGLPEAPHPPKKIAVLGAGIAGLVAASELVAAGHEVTIVEAQPRVGGRIRTLRAPFSPGLYNEAGPMRIPAQHALTLAYAARFNLPLRPFLSFNPRAWFYTHGQRVRLGQVLNGAVPAAFPLREDERAQTLSQRWEEIMAPIRAELAAQPGAWQVIMDRLQRVSLRSFLLRSGWSEATVEFYGLFAGMESLLFASAAEFVREYLWELRTNTLTIDGGMDQLPMAFLPLLADRIRFNTRVHALDQHAEGVRILTTSLGCNAVLEADYAICTLPFSVLRHIEVHSPFSWDKRKAIRNLHYESATRIFFECREQFWETEGIRGGCSVTDLAIRNVFYPEHDAQTARGVLIASYSHGQDAQRWGSLDEKERLVQAMENVEEIHPGCRQYITGGASVVWSQDPHAGGAYAFFQPHQEKELHQAIVKPEGRYYFAGEHASKQHRWIEGAIESALRAVEAIHAHP